MFNLDWTRLAYRLLTPLRRKERILTLLYSFLEPLITLHADFLSFREDTNYFVFFTGQMIYLEHLLNDLFDPTSRGIYIEDNSPLQNPFIYNKSEIQAPNTFIYNKAEAQPPSYLYQKSEVLDDVDFIVKVPVAVSFDETYMKAIINRYKIAGKRYSIETF